MKLSTLVGASGLLATATPVKGAGLFGRIASPCFRDLKRSSWRKTSKNMSKWRKLFEWITQQLTDSDTSSHRWQVDGPKHFRTFNRIRELLPGAQGSHNVYPGRCSVVTTYGILVKKGLRKRDRLNSRHDRARSILTEPAPSKWKSWLDTMLDV